MKSHDIVGAPTISCRHDIVPPPTILLREYDIVQRSCYRVCVRYRARGAISSVRAISRVRVVISHASSRYRAPRTISHTHTRYRRCARRYPVPLHDIARRAHDNAGGHDTTPRRAISRACVRYYRAAHGIANTHDSATSHTISARGHDIGALPRYRARTTILLTGLRNREIPRYRDPPVNIAQTDEW